MESGPPPKLIRSIEACVEALPHVDALRQAVIGLLAEPDDLARFSVALFQLELARKGDEGARQNVGATAERLLEFWHDGSGGRLAQTLPALGELWAKAAATLAAFETRRFAKTLKDCWAARNDADALDAAMAHLVPEGADRVEFAKCLYHLRLAKLGREASRQEFTRRAVTLSQAYREQSVADELIGGDEGLAKLWGVVQPLLKAFFGDAPDRAAAVPSDSVAEPMPTAPTANFEVRHETRRLPVESVPPLASLGSPQRVTIPRGPRPSAPPLMRRDEVKTDPAAEAVRPPRASPGDTFATAPTAPTAPAPVVLAPLTNPTPFPSMRAAAPPPPAPPPPSLGIGGIGGDGGLFTADLLASALPPPGAAPPKPAPKKPKAPAPEPALATEPRAPTPKPAPAPQKPAATQLHAAFTPLPSPAPAASPARPAATQLHAAFTPMAPPVPGPSPSRPAATQLHAAFSPMAPPAPASAPAASPSRPAATQLHAAFTPMPAPPPPAASLPPGDEPTPPSGTTVPAPALALPPSDEPTPPAGTTVPAPASSIPQPGAALAAPEPPLLEASVEAEAPLLDAIVSDDGPLLDAALTEAPSPPAEAPSALDEVAVDEGDLIDATFVEATLADTPVMEAALSTPPGGIQTRNKTGSSFLDLVAIDEAPPVSGGAGLAPPPPPPPPETTPPGGSKAASLELDIEEIEPEPPSGGRLPSAAALLRPSAPPPPPPAAMSPPPPPRPKPSRPQRVSLDLELGPYDPDANAQAFWQFAIQTLDLLPKPNEVRVAARLLPTETKEERKVLLDFIGACRPHAQVPDARAFACLLSLSMAGQLKEKTMFGKANEERTEAFRRAFAFLAADDEAAGRAASWFAFDGPMTEHELWQGLDVLVSFLAFCSRNELSPLDAKAQATFLRAPPL